ncbi:TetR family transcriptional regulator [Nocardia xishanensis]|uniref:TetR family transcriptional regulator n=1 Tax=Nocardia xishanensis TaxID=238964 RepID=A0ABW7WZX5_9NOCA
MPRTHDMRKLAEPRTTSQRERCDRMLRAAAELGARHGLEQVQIGDIAAGADVALGTLYRYFPSKHHLYAALLADRVERMPIPRTSAVTATAAVAEAMGTAVRAMLTSVPLARAMIVSINVVRNEYGLNPPFAMDERILGIAGLHRPTAEDRRLARLVEQAVYGVLTWATAGEITPEQAVDDVERACELLLAPWQRRARGQRPADPRHRPDS